MMGFSLRQVFGQLEPCVTSCLQQCLVAVFGGDRAPCAALEHRPVGSRGGFLEFLISCYWPGKTKFSIGSSLQYMSRVGFSPLLVALALLNEVQVTG